MANKKINQLVSKTSILSTDLFGIGDATTGQLFKKTIAELQAAIGGAVISVNGLVGTVVLDTDDIQELATPTNKYFTDARARGAISLTVTGNSGASTYSSGTGVLNVPTYTLAGLGGITASFLSGTSGISYNSTTGVISYSGTVYTDSSIRALLSGGTGITYNSSTGAISYSGTVYTDSSVRALISITTTGTSGASTYNNTTGVINVPNYTLAGLGGISLTSLSGGTGITYNNTTGAISYSGTVYTDASVRALISASGAVSYNNTTGVISLTSGNLTEATSSVLTITGGTGAVLGSGTSIQVKQATTSVSGFLSSTDWNTFNNKQSALTNPVTGTGTTNYHAKWTSSSAIGDSLIYDNGSKISIGTTSPEGLVTIKGTSVQPPTSGTTANSLLQLVGSLGNELNIGSNTVTGGYGSYIQASDNNLAVPYPLNLQPNGGNVGIGVSTNPAYLLEISANVADWGFVMQNSNASGYGVFIKGGKSDGTTNSLQVNNQAGTALFTLKGNGAATFTSSSGEPIVINSTNATTLNTVYKYNNGTQLGYIGTGQGLITGGGSTIFAIRSENSMAFSVSGGNIALSLTSGANTLLGTTSDNGERLYVSGAIRATGTITANSDLILKKNLLKIENALEKVEQINGYTYEFKEDDSKRHAGVIAQEIQTVLPEIVNKGNDGILGVEYGNISALLIEAIKEQNIKIKNLETLLASK